MTRKPFKDIENERDANMQIKSTQETAQSPSTPTIHTESQSTNLQFQNEVQMNIKLSEHILISMSRIQ